jgi:hypothetical protein
MAIDERPSDEALRGLVEEARSSGSETVRVEVTAGAASGWLRAGFSEVARMLEAPVEALERRLRGAGGRSFGSVHVQTDDVDAVVRAVRQFVPRLPGSSEGSVVTPPCNGWIAAYDELCDRDPEMLRRLARELSDRMGAVVLLLGVEEEQVVRFVLFERGRLMDEYLSVPEYHGELPPGDVISLAANPTVVARLTGADPARVRSVIRTADRPEDLSQATELIGEIAAVLGVEGAAHGYAAAHSTEGAVLLPRE